MAYYRKNKRRFDPRYFMNERTEQLDELNPGDGSGPDFTTGPRTPREMARELARAAKEKRLEDEDYAAHHLQAAADEQEEIDDRNKIFNHGGLEENNLEESLEDEGCDPSEFSIHIKVFPGQAKPNILSGDDLNAMVKTAEIWKKNPAIEISYMSPEIEKKLGGEQERDLEES